jgi:hypothetical protein
MGVVQADAKGESARREDLDNVADRRFPPCFTDFIAENPRMPGDYSMFLLVPEVNLFVETRLYHMS